VATNLRFARNAAVKQKVLYQIVVNDSGESNPNTYKIQHKPGGSWLDYTKLDLDLPGGVEIKAGSVNTIGFDSRGVATLNPSGQSITLEAPNDTSYVIQISTTGAVTVIEQ
jgi:hypothetical protein